jgi:hypothetical protein
MKPTTDVHEDLFDGASTSALRALTTSAPFSDSTFSAWAFDISNSWTYISSIEVM